MKITDSLEETLVLGKIEGRRRGATEDEMVRCLYRRNGLSLSKFWEIVKDREALCAEAHGAAKRWTQLGD